MGKLNKLISLGILIVVFCVTLFIINDINTKQEQKQIEPKKHSKAIDYARWIVANEDKKGTPEFDTVAKAYQIAKQQELTEDKQEDEKPIQKARPSVDFGSLVFALIVGLIIIYFEEIKAYTKENKQMVTRVAIVFSVVWMMIGISFGIVAGFAIIPILIIGTLWITNRFSLR